MMSSGGAAVERPFPASGPVRLAVLTISDAGARGERVDTSGDAIVAWGERRGYTIAVRELVADEPAEIVSRLVTWCDGGDVDSGRAPDARPSPPGRLPPPPPRRMPMRRLRKGSEASP